MSREGAGGEPRQNPQHKKPTGNILFIDERDGDFSPPISSLKVIDAP